MDGHSVKIGNVFVVHNRQSIAHFTPPLTAPKRLVITMTAFRKTFEATTNEQSTNTTETNRNMTTTLNPDTPKSNVTDSKVPRTPLEMTNVCSTTNHPLMLGRTRAVKRSGRMVEKPVKFDF